MAITRSMVKRHMFPIEMQAKRPRVFSITNICNLPQGVTEMILDELHGIDLYNAITASKSIASVANTGLYASKRLNDKFGNMAFPVAALRADAYQDNMASVGPDSIVYTLATRYNSNVFATHPKTGYAGIHYAAMEGNAPLMRFILAQGESIDRPFPDNCSQRVGYSPIMLAMEMSGGQMTEVIRDLLDHGVSEDYTCHRTGYNALHFAATLDSAECLSALIHRGWDARRVTTIGNTAMMLARNVDIVDTLYMEASVLANKARESDGVTPLMCMAHKNRHEAMRRLLALGAYVNTKDVRGANAAFYASTTYVLDILDDAGVDMYTFDVDAMSPLHYAATVGAYKVALSLVWDYKMSIFRRNTATNMSPLDIAVKNGHCDIVKMLLEYCPVHMRHDLLLQYATYDAGTELRHMPVHAATESDNPRVLEQLLRWCSTEQISAPVDNSPHGHKAVHLAVHSLSWHSPVFSVLRHYGADFNAVNASGCSPLYIACRLGMRDTVRRLMHLGATVNAQAANGARVPLYGAMEALEEDVEMVQMLVFAGGDIMHVPVDANGTTVLHLAALYNKPQVLQFLLPHASRELLDAVRPGEVSGTALHCAVHGSAQECMELLIAAGTDPRIPNKHGMTPYESACEIHEQDVADGFPWSIQGAMAARLSELEVEIIEVIDEL